MNKNLFALLILFCSLIAFPSCGDDDDTGIDEEWKAYNEQQIKDIDPEYNINSEYKKLMSISKNGSVYWKDIRHEKFFGEGIPEVDPTSAPPIFTDSVAIRYEGSYLNLDGTEYVFDSTEKDNHRIYRTRVSNNIDGFTTILQYMRIGDQREVYIPWQLGYKESGQYNGYTQVIKGYTTLRFKIYLMDIIREEK
ncbi:FKBP-type peptidyl-prolyl cis-trans isomerase [Dysgonomonas sp. Marseille-P4677]|uniref:FKBP-type peptidyl-prolyl cis-trans isomerase n=1 Tax=Dysgonomonas sp. Marseille-P4677 TaxID=2364790 RepID=UPI001914D25F|nr:FKBP-type peptidyl-prolyl cis-trans isomerase [Dysgonomonas sp. Marseille-P4677]MBK5722472.1 FKBP-type peptidyl-prolyl cis-trans isomerase [Dysgonomonas sp. Marseille-P4677]